MGARKPGGSAAARGAQGEKPLFDLSFSPTRAEYARFCRAHYQRHIPLRLAAAVGFSMAAFGAVDYFLLGGIISGIVEAALGMLLSSLALVLAPALASVAARRWTGPFKARYRFYEDGFEARSGEGVARHAYRDVTELAASGGALYLYTGRMRAYALPASAISSCAGELAAFLERKTGRRFKR